MPRMFRPLTHLAALCLLLLGTRALAAETMDMQLQEAASMGDLPGVERLLKEGADINTQDYWGKTPLHNAIFYHHRAVAEFLIAQGASLTLKEIEHGATPLHFAAMMGMEDVTRAIVARQADPFAKSSTGWIPQHWAGTAEDCCEGTMLQEAGWSHIMTVHSDHDHKELLEEIRKHHEDGTFACGCSCGPTSERVWERTGSCGYTTGTRMLPDPATGDLSMVPHGSYDGYGYMPDGYGWRGYGYGYRSYRYAHGPYAAARYWYGEPSDMGTRYWHYLPGTTQLESLDGHVMRYPVSLDDARYTHDGMDRWPMTADGWYYPYRSPYYALGHTAQCGAGGCKLYRHSGYHLDDPHLFDGWDGYGGCPMAGGGYGCGGSHCGYGWKTGTVREAYDTAPCGAATYWEPSASSPCGLAEPPHDPSRHHLSCQLHPTTPGDPLAVQTSCCTFTGEDGKRFRRIRVWHTHEHSHKDANGDTFTHNHPHFHELVLEIKAEKKK